MVMAWGIGDGGWGMGTIADGQRSAVQSRSGLVVTTYDLRLSNLHSQPPSPIPYPPRSVL